MNASENFYISDERGQPIVFAQCPARLARRGFTILGIFFAVCLWASSWLFLAFALGQGRAGPQSETGKTVLFLTAWVTLFVVLIGVFVLLESKRHVTFYRDDTKADKLLEVIQDHKWQIPLATFTVRTGEGRVLARFRKNCFSHLLRKRWYCETPSRTPICLAVEDSVNKFVILCGDRRLGVFNCQAAIPGTYALDLAGDSNRTLNRQVALALGVVLTA